MLKKKNWFYSLLLSASRLVDHIIKDRKKLFFLFIIGLLGLFLIKEFKGIFYLLILIGLGAVSMIYIRFFNFAHYIGFELCMMATVLSTLRFGSSVGAFVGFSSITLALIISGYFKPTYFISVIALPLVAILVPLFGSLNLWQLGLLMTLIYDLIVLPLYILMGSRVISSIVFFITHMISNYWIFRTLAPLIIRIFS
ncbi:MAG: hypothetical protein ABIJ34_05975 [archaeon]